MDEAIKTAASAITDLWWAKPNEGGDAKASVVENIIRTHLDDYLRNGGFTSSRMGLLASAPVEWDHRVGELLKGGTGEVQELATWLDAMAVRCARLSGYLEGRGAIGCGDNGHEYGVKRSNRKAAMVRKALGFTYAKQDISF